MLEKLVYMKLHHCITTSVTSNWKQYIFYLFLSMPAENLQLWFKVIKFVKKLHIFVPGLG